MAAARPILWDIYEEHLDEAAFLWGMWEQALVGAGYALHDVIVGPEERLRAHLDGLVLGGEPVATKLLLPALAEAEPGKVAAAAWALLQAEDGDRLDAVLEAAAAVTEPAALAALARAFELCDRQDLPARLAPRFEASAPPVQGLIAAALACRQGKGAAPAGGLPLHALFSSPDPALRSAGLRALRKAREQQLTRSFAPFLEEALSAEHAGLRDTALEAGVVLGVRAAWDAAAKRPANGAPAARLSLALLALGGEPTALFDLLQAPDQRPHALWALGFAGTFEAAEAAIALIGDDEVAKLAADSFTMITGVAIAGALVKPGETDNSPPDPAQDDAPPPAIKPEDELPVPDPARVVALWDKAKSRFKPGVRHLFGQPVSAQTMLAALAISPMWRRRPLCLELAARSALDVDALQWARSQRIDAAFPAGVRFDRPLPSLANL